MQYLLITRPAHALVILEADMPRKNGFECLTEIRANREFKNFNPVMLTKEDCELIKNAVKKGANYVMQMRSIMFLNYKP